MVLPGDVLRVFGSIIYWQQGSVGEEVKENEVNWPVVWAPEMAARACPQQALDLELLSESGSFMSLGLDF